MNNLIVSYNHITSVQCDGEIKIDLDSYDLTNETTETFRDKINDLIYERTEKPLKNLDSVGNIDIVYFTVDFGKDQLNDAISKAKKNYDELHKEAKIYEAQINESIKEVVKKYILNDWCEHSDTININEFDSCVEKACSKIENSGLTNVLLKELYKFCNYAIEDQITEKKVNVKSHFNETVGDPMLSMVHDSEELPFDFKPFD